MYDKIVNYSNSKGLYSSFVANVPFWESWLTNCVFEIPSSKIERKTRFPPIFAKSPAEFHHRSRQLSPKKSGHLTMPCNSMFSELHGIIAWSYFLHRHIAKCGECVSIAKFHYDARNSKLLNISCQVDNVPYGKIF